MNYMKIETSPVVQEVIDKVDAIEKNLTNKVDIMILLLIAMCLLAIVVYFIN